MDKETLLKLIDDLTFERTEYVQVPAKSKLESTGMATMYQTQIFRLVNADILKGFVANMNDEAEAEILRLREGLRELRNKDFRDDDTVNEFIDKLLKIEEAKEF